MNFKAYNFTFRSLIAYYESKYSTVCGKYNMKFVRFTEITLKLRRPKGRQLLHDCSIMCDREGAQ